LKWQKDLSQVPKIYMNYQKNNLIFLIMKQIVFANQVKIKNKMELQILKSRVILHKTLLKLKASREEIEQKNEHRKDLINSMLETENELSEVLTTFLILEKQSREFSQSAYRLERLNLELKCEIKQLNNELKANNF
jgi:hypothetical protein